MRRTRAPDNTNSLPAMTDTETGGYYKEGPPATVFSKDDANTIQEELVAVATMKGASLDTTGANLHQVKDAVDAVLGVEAKSAEATGVDTIRTLVVIASNDATVGEDGGGVVNALVAASDTGSAKGFQTAVLASTDSRAGKTDGSTINAAVIASDGAIAEGDRSAAIACFFDGDAGPWGDHSAAIACEGEGTMEVGAAACAGIASFNVAVIDAQYSAAIAAAGGGVNGANTSVIMATDSSDVSGGQSVAIGGNSHDVSGSKSAVLGGSDITVSGDGAAAVASGLGFGGTVSGDGAATIAADEATASGDRSLIAASFNCDVAKHDSAIIGSERCTIPSGANTNIVMLASYGCDADTGQGGAGAAQFSVCGGWDSDITDHVPPSWRMDSNGGHIRGDGTVATGGMDYAEFFKNGDGKEHGAALILMRKGKAAVLAQPGARVLGTVSVAPMIIGGDDSLSWRGRYERDEFGAVVMHEVEIVTKRRDKEAARAYDLAVKTARGAAMAAGKARAAAAKAQRDAVKAHAKHAAASLVQRALRAIKRLVGLTTEDTAAALTAANEAVTVATAEHTSAKAALAAIPKPAPIEERRKVMARKTNPEWDRKREHTPRSKRPDEHTCVSLMGQVPVRVDATVGPDDDVVAGKDGVGTRGTWIGRGAQIECMEIVAPFDAAKGYGIALCLVR